MTDYHEYAPELLASVFDHRLQQEDIRRILDSLSRDDRETFLNKISETFGKFTALLEVSNRLADSLSLDVLFSRLVELTTEALRADRGTIFLNDYGANELFSRIATGAAAQEIRFPNHLGIAGAVFTSGEALIIPEAYADARFNREIDKKTGYRTRNILTSPIRDKQRKVVGVIQILNKQEGDFTDSDLSLLEAMGSQAASALIKAQLYEEVERSRREEQELFEVTRAISTEIRLLPLMQKIMATATLILEADRSTLFIHDPATKELWSMVAQGIDTKEIRFPRHMGIAGTVFTTGETVNIADAYADPRFNQEIDRKTGYHTKSILCMPVRNKEGAAIGVIQSLNRAGGPFTWKDEQRLDAFSSQAAIAYENARLFTDVLNMRNYNESILESMSNGLITLDADGLVEKYNRTARTLLRMEGDCLSGRAVHELFSGVNGWVARTVEGVAISGHQDMVLDTELELSDGKKVSMNLTVVPLFKMTATDASAEEHDDTCTPEEQRALRIKGMSSSLVATSPASRETLLVFEDISGEKRLKGTLARYMSKEVADQLIGDAEVNLGGQTKNATILFSDIRSFTTISEQMGAQETVSMLNEYFTDMVDTLFRHGGILDKYIGDAIMAVFGTPFPSGRDADQAVLAAVEMMQALWEFNRRRRAEGKRELDIGIGLNTADVVVGNIGSLKRMDYTVIGDGVNLASRLEGANKLYGSHILISEFTAAALHDAYCIREVDLIRVKGKHRPVGIYEVLDFHTPQSFPERDAVLQATQEGVSLYRAGEWEKSRALFAHVQVLHPADNIARLYIERCDLFMREPPGLEWDGVWSMTSK